MYRFMSNIVQITICFFVTQIIVQNILISHLGHLKNSFKFKVMEIVLFEHYLTL